MFGIGMQELMIILVVALLVLGPTKLPSLARTLGKGLRELRRASDELRMAVMVDLEEEEAKARRSRRPEPARELPAKEEGGEPSIHGSLLATAGTADVTEEVEGAEEAPVLRPAEGAVAREDEAPQRKSPDPDDANDHSGMPFSPDGPEVEKILAEARARAKAAEGGALENPEARKESAG